MKLLAVSILLLVIISLSCADSKVIDGVEYSPYGLFDEDEFKDDNIQYSVSGQNVFWMIIFSETLLVPVLILGFDLWEPERIKIINQ